MAHIGLRPPEKGCPQLAKADLPNINVKAAGQVVVASSLRECIREGTGVESRIWFAQSTLKMVSSARRKCFGFQADNLFQLKGWIGVVVPPARRSLQAAVVANKAAATKNHPKEFSPKNFLDFSKHFW